MTSYNIGDVVWVHSESRCIGLHDAEPERSTVRHPRAPRGGWPALVVGAPSLQRAGFPADLVAEVETTWRKHLLRVAASAEPRRAASTSSGRGASTMDEQHVMVVFIQTSSYECVSCERICPYHAVPPLAPEHKAFAAVMVANALVSDTVADPESIDSELYYREWCIVSGETSAHARAGISIDVCTHALARQSHPWLGRLMWRRHNSNAWPVLVVSSWALRHVDAPQALVDAAAEIEVAYKSARATDVLVLAPGHVDGFETLDVRTLQPFDDVSKTMHRLLAASKQHDNIPGVTQVVHVLRRKYPTLELDDQYPALRSRMESNRADVPAGALPHRAMIALVTAMPTAELAHVTSTERTMAKDIATPAERPRTKHRLRHAMEFSESRTDTTSQLASEPSAASDLLAASPDDVLHDVRIGRSAAWPEPGLAAVTSLFAGQSPNTVVPTPAASHTVPSAAQESSTISRKRRRADSEGVEDAEPARPLSHAAETVPTSRPSSILELRRKLLHLAPVFTLEEQTPPIISGVSPAEAAETSPVVQRRVDFTSPLLSEDAPRRAAAPAPALLQRTNQAQIRSELVAAVNAFSPDDVPAGRALSVPTGAPRPAVTSPRRVRHENRTLRFSSPQEASEEAALDVDVPASQSANVNVESSSTCVRGEQETDSAHFASPQAPLMASARTGYTAVSPALTDLATAAPVQCWVAPSERPEGQQRVLDTDADPLRRRWPGRDDAISACSRWVREPCASSPAILLGGPAGSGKTTFLAELQSRSACWLSIMRCTRVGRSREFYEGVLRCAADAAVACIRRHAMCFGTAVLAGALDRVISCLLVERAHVRDASVHYVASGIQCAMALARWAGTASNALREAVLTTVSSTLGPSAEASAAFDADHAAHSAAAGGSLAHLRERLATARCSSHLAFVEELHAMLAMSALELHASCDIMPSHGVPCSTPVHPKLAGLLGASTHMTAPLVPRLVLDDAEALLDVDEGLLPLMATLSRECERPVAVLFTSRAPATVLAGLGGAPRYRPQLVVFDAPSRAAVELLLQEWCPSWENADAFALYVQQVLNTFFPLVRGNFPELLYLVRSLYAVYMEPADSGLVGRLDVLRLRKAAAPYFDMARASLFRRDLDTLNRRASRRTLPAADDPGASDTAVDVVTTLPRQRGVDLELAYIPKLILLSAFCASMNSAASDKLFFSRAATGRRRATAFSKTKLAAMKRKTALMGPRAFPFHRLMTILEGFVRSHEQDDNDGPQSAGMNGPGATPPAATSRARIEAASTLPSDGQILQQLAQLVHMGLIARVSAPDELVAPRYRCSISFETAVNVASSVRVDLGKFLEDGAS